MSEPVRLERRPAVAVIVIDNPPVNALSAAVRQGLQRAVETFAADAALGVAVVRCQGQTFAAGADIREFGRPPEPPLLPDLYALIEACPKPIVAAVHGTAFGGGLELALACHARIALDTARLGLPEVKLGLIPGAGGTQRLPRLIVLERALRMMVSGDPVDAQEALASGLVDRVVSGDLEAAAVEFAQSLVSTGAWRRTSELPVREPPEDDEARKRLEASVLAKCRGQHAPVRVVEAVCAAVDRPFAEGMRYERRLFEKCRADEQSAAMRHLFFAERASGKVEGTARLVERVGVIGAGTMGAGIAIALADAGVGVALIDVDADSLARGRERVSTHYRGLTKRGRLSAEEAEKRIARIEPGSAVDRVGNCSLVIEAVFENLAVKREVFAKLDALLPTGALLATNTSYLNVDEIAAATKRPESVLGLHFFSPANIMKLVEVVRGAHTSRDALATGATLARRMGKIPVVVGNAPGFVGNRMLQAYGRESQLLLLEGATPWQVDAALEHWGMAMGPNAVGDLAGLDIGYRARRERRDLPDDPRYFCVADKLAELGRLGQKTGRGSYLYPAGGGRQNDPEVESIIEAEAARLGVSRRAVADEEIVERCIFALINEGAALLTEGIAERASDIDVVWANGYGFPRYRGGPMWFADTVGAAAVLDTIRRLERQCGPRFWTPAALLLEHASKGVGFY